MAEAMTTTTKTVLGIIVSLIVIAGMVAGLTTTRVIKAQVDKTQDDRIGKLDKDVGEIETRVDKVELKAAEELGVKKAIFESLHRMETAQKEQSKAVKELSNDFTKEINVIKIDIATAKKTVENLEKAN